jgi:hypothetical protein
LACCWAQQLPQLRAELVFRQLVGRCKRLFEYRR